MHKPIVLTSEVTTRIWKNWLIKVEGETGRIPHRMRYSYDAPHHDRFQTWLWNQGAVLRKINKQYCIEAYDSDATMISLKWG